ncbi:MAG: hypothetical protein PWK00_01020, partial [Coxiella burnetii]|nr:hypothetical protein [Coxiella burnetii]
HANRISVLLDRKNTMFSYDYKAMTSKKKTRQTVMEGKCQRNLYPRKGIQGIKVSKHCPSISLWTRKGRDV